MMRHGKKAILAALIMVAGCGDGGAGAGGVTAEESDQLNEAAAMLDAEPETMVAADESGLGNGEASLGNADGGEPNEGAVAGR